MTSSGPMAREGPNQKSREVLSRMRAHVGCGCKTSFFQSKPFQLAEKVTLVIIELSNFCLLFIHPYLTYHPYMPSIPLFDSQKKHTHTLLLSIYYVCPNQSLITTIQLQSHISYIHFEWDKAQELMVMNTQLLFILIKQTPNIATLKKRSYVDWQKSKNPWLKLISFDVKNLQPIYHQCTVLSESITGWSTTPPVRCV